MILSDDEAKAIQAYIDEIADLKRQLRERDAQYDAVDYMVYQELQAAIRCHLRETPEVKKEAADLLQGVFTICKRGKAALDAYVQEKVDRAAPKAVVAALEQLKAQMNQNFHWQYFEELLAANRAKAGSSPSPISKNNS